MQAVCSLTRSLRGVSGGLLFYATANYVTLTIAAWRLDNHEFGLFTVYYALLSLLLVPASALRLFAIRASAAGPRVPVRTALISTLTVASIALLIAAPWSSAGDPELPVHCGLVVVATLLAGVGWLGRGTMQAAGRYVSYSLSFVAEAVCRLVLLFGLLQFWASTSSVLVAILLSRVAGLVGISRREIGQIDAGRVGVARWVRTEYLPIVTANAALVALYSVDILVVSARYPQETGDYGALTVAGKLLLFAASLLGEAYLGVRYLIGPRAIGILLIGSFCIWVPLLGACLAAPIAVLRLVAGSQHLGLAGQFGSYVWFAAGCGLAQVLFLEGVLTNRHALVGAALALALLFEGSVLLLVVDSIDSHLAALPWVGAAALALLALVVLLPSRRVSRLLPAPRRRQQDASASWSN